jgi:hypothetical protein
VLAIRWTIGDVAPRGFAALRASLWGAWRVFGQGARYRVYVNTLGLGDAKARCGDVPRAIEWCASEPRLPAWLSRVVDRGMAQGVAWKLVPLRAFPDDHELALDNDVILWEMPPAIRDWLDGRARFVLAEDVKPCFGRFAAHCGDRPLNSGIRGLPPGFDLESALCGVLARTPGMLSSELDEQGLQIAALLAGGPTAIVDREDVTICSPFPPHVPHLGRVGAHFVGLNTRQLSFRFDGRNAADVRAEHWDSHAAEVCRRVGI